MKKFEYKTLFVTPGKMSGVVATASKLEEGFGVQLTEIGAKLGPDWELVSCTIAVPNDKCLATFKREITEVSA